MKNLAKPESYLDDREFQAMLVSCVEALERGEPIDRGALLRRNPRYADLIGEFLDDRESLARVANNFRSSLEPADGDPHEVDETIASSPKGEGFTIGDSIRYIGEYEILEEIARGGMAWCSRPASSG